MRIGVVGAGYVGLVTAVSLAKQGHEVRCFEQNKACRTNLKSGEVSFFEPGLSEFLREVLLTRTLQFTDSVTDAFERVHLILVAVGTPNANGKIDLSQLEEVLKAIGLYLKSSDYVSIVIRSTVPPTTTDTYVRSLLERISGKQLGVGFGLGMNPEFFRQGSAVADYEAPDRIILGYEDDRTRALLRQVYEPFVCPMIECTTREAEMIKYVSNVLLALQVSAASELARISYALGGIDLKQVFRAVFADRRWNGLSESGERMPVGITRYFAPSCGFGGSCLPKDTEALVRFAQSCGVEPTLFNAVLNVNQTQVHEAIKVLQRFVGGFEDKKCLVLGLAFKAGTADTRGSVGMRIVQELCQEGVRVLAHDPEAFRNTSWANGFDWKLCENWRTQVEQVDFVVIAADWLEYRELMLPEMRVTLSDKALFDAGGFYEQADFLGANYVRMDLSSS